jgi:hypothetical protein
MDVWNKLIRDHPQIFLVLCGHHQRTVSYVQPSGFDILAGARPASAMDGWAE